MYYTGCSYQGESTADGRRFDGQGIYTFSNGNTYVGSFSDGRMHGHGTLFFTAERGGGQYRGVWENGRNVSGSFVFSDGLLFGSRKGTVASSSAERNGVGVVDATGSAPGAAQAAVKNENGVNNVGNSVVRGVTSNGGAENNVKNDGDGCASGGSSVGNGGEDEGEWLYCREGDRRLWAEHLREVMPVLPQQALLGGVRLPQSQRWAQELVVAPSVALEAKTPAMFAQGQPRCLSDVPATYWEDPKLRAEVVAALQCATPPFFWGAGQREAAAVAGGDGDVRSVMNLSLRLISPLRSEAMERAIAEAVAASLAKRTPPTPQDCAALETETEATTTMAVAAEEDETKNVLNVIYVHGSSDIGYTETGCGGVPTPLKESISGAMFSHISSTPLSNCCNSMHTDFAASYKNFSRATELPEACANVSQTKQDSVDRDTAIFESVESQLSTGAKKVDCETVCCVDISGRASPSIEGLETKLFLREKKKEEDEHEETP